MAEIGLILEITLFYEELIRVWIDFNLYKFEFYRVFEVEEETC